MSSPKAALRGRAFLCRAPPRFGFHSPSAIIHDRRVWDRWTDAQPAASARSHRIRAPWPAPSLAYVRTRAWRGSRVDRAVHGSPPRRPTSSKRRLSRRKCRRLNPSISAPRLAETNPSRTCRSTANRSRSLRLNVSISSPGSVYALHLEQADTETAPFYFDESGHFYSNATALTRAFLLFSPIPMHSYPQGPWNPS